MRYSKLLAMGFCMGVIALPTKAHAGGIEFMSTDETVTKQIIKTDVEVTPVEHRKSEDEDINFLSDELAVLTIYGEQKAKEEEEAKVKKAEEERKKAEAEAKKRNMVSNKPSSSGGGESSYQPVANVSGLRLATHNDDYDTMIRKINSMLSGKGMAGQGVHIVNAGLAQNIDPYFITAISMTESTGGTFTIRPYNAWGRKARGGGWMTWGSWEEAIHNQAQYLAKNYLNIGLTSLESIGRKYCPPTYMDWARKVRGFQNQTSSR